MISQLFSDLCIDFAVYNVVYRLQCPHPVHKPYMASLIPKLKCLNSIKAHFMSCLWQDIEGHVQLNYHHSKLVQHRLLFLIRKKGKK